MRPILFLTALFGGCQSVPDLPPLEIARRVELERFMGDWYVIASIPTFIEKGAHNALESYALNADGTIATTFTFRKDAFDGAPRRYTPTGYVRDRESNAVWGMQFVWPIKADYRILYVAPDYSTTVIAREKRDYAWIMARESSIPESQYRRLAGLLAAQGYDISKLRRVPQRWS